MQNEFCFWRLLQRRRAISSEDKKCKPKFNNLVLFFKKEHQPLTVHSDYIQLVIKNHIKRKRSKGKISKFNVNIYLDETIVSEYVNEDRFFFKGQFLVSHSFELTKHEQRAIHKLKFVHLRDDPYLFIQKFKEVFKKLDSKSDKSFIIKPI